LGQIQIKPKILLEFACGVCDYPIVEVLYAGFDVGRVTLDVKYGHALHVIVQIF